MAPKKNAKTQKAEETKADVVMDNDPKQNEKPTKKKRGKSAAPKVSDQGAAANNSDQKEESKVVENTKRSKGSKGTKRQKREVSTAEQTTKSTVMAAEEETKGLDIQMQDQKIEESKVETSKPAKKKGRNRTKVVDMQTLGDDEGELDEDEILKKVLAMSAKDGSKVASAATANGSDLKLETKELVDAIEAALSDDEEKKDIYQEGADSDNAFDEEMKVDEAPTKAKKQLTKKAQKGKKEAANNKQKDDGQGKAAKNKHAKAPIVKVMMNEQQSYDGIKEYMVRQNRPYSLQNVMDNMHGRVPRKICQNVLDKLTDEKVLVCKEFGKAKVYLANQDNFPETNQDQLTELDEQIKEKKKALDDRQSELKQLQAKLKNLTNSMSNETYLQKISHLKEENKVNEEKLMKYTQGGVTMITEEEIQMTKTDYEKYQKHWRTRRRFCNEIIDMICENLDMRRNEFYEQVGIDPDNEYGVDISQFPNTADL